MITKMSSRNVVRKSWKWLRIIDQKERLLVTALKQKWKVKWSLNLIKNENEGVNGKNLKCIWKEEENLVESDKVNKREDLIGDVDRIPEMREQILIIHNITRLW